MKVVPNNGVYEWDKIITLEMTYKELQIIYDCVANISGCTLYDATAHEYPWSNTVEECTSELNQVFISLDTIIDNDIKKG